MSLSVSSSVSESTCASVSFSPHLKGCTGTTQANRDAATVFHVSIRLTLLPIHFVKVIVLSVRACELAANFNPMSKAQKPNIRYCHCDDLRASRFQEIQGTIAGGDNDRVSIFEPRPKDAETDPFEALGVGESLQERERGIKRGNNREAQRGKRERGIEKRREGKEREALVAKGG